jgi:hypothetical protein
MTTIMQRGGKPWHWVLTLKSVWPMRGVYINWLRGQLTQLKIDWFRLIESRHKDKKVQCSKISGTG